MRNAVMVGDRVYLRPLEVDDAKVAAEASHFETDTFIGRGRNLQSPIASEHQIREMYPDRMPYEVIAFAICLTSDDRFIGMVDLDEVDLVNGVAETGIWIHDPTYRKRGFGTEAYQLLLEHAFGRLHLERVTARVFESNRRSAVLHERLRYRSVGHYKYHETKDGRYQDILVFDMARSEWLETRGETSALTPDPSPNAGRGENN